MTNFFNDYAFWLAVLIIVAATIYFVYRKPIEEFFKNSAFKTFAVVAFFAVIFIFITFNWLIELSAFAVGIAKGTLGVFLVWIFDKYAMKEIDTIQELKKGNIAYALFILGLCIVIGSAIINS